MTIQNVKHIIAHKIWLLSQTIVSYWFGKIFFQIHKLVSIISFQGQILFKDHNINPVKDANVAILYFLNSRVNTFENNIIQIIAHNKKINIVTISKFLIARIIVSYIHNNTSIKLPEIHGRIIAHIAMAPQIKTHHHVEVIDNGVLAGDVIKKAIIQNIIKQAIVFRFRLTCFHKNIAEINIRPTKKDQINIG